MTPVEILALLLAVFVLVKIIICLIDPTHWMKFADSVVKKSSLLMLVYVVLAAIVGYYLFQTVSIIDAAAVMFFMSFVVMVSFIPFADRFMGLAKDAMANRNMMLQKCWLPIIFWVVFCILVLWKLFG